MLFFLLLTVLAWCLFGVGGLTIVLGACTLYCLLQGDPDTWGRDLRARQRERREARAARQMTAQGPTFDPAAPWETPEAMPPVFVRRAPGLIRRARGPARRLARVRRRLARHTPHGSSRLA